MQSDVSENILRFYFFLKNKHSLFNSVVAFGSIWYELLKHCLCFVIKEHCTSWSSALLRVLSFSWCVFMRISELLLSLSRSFMVDGWWQIVLVFLLRVAIGYGPVMQNYLMLSHMCFEKLFCTSADLTLKNMSSHQKASGITKLFVVFLALKSTGYQTTCDIYANEVEVRC